MHRVADRSEASLVTWMSGIGDQVTVICDPREPRKKEFEEAGAHVVPLRISNRLDLFAIPTIRKLCKQKPIDILYSSFNAGISCSLLATIGLPTRVVAYRGTLGNLSLFDPSSYLTHLSPILTGIVCNCAPIKKFLVSLGLREDTIRVVYKGHDPLWYKVSLPISKKDLQVPEDHLVVGLVANMRPLKGVEILIEAMRPLFEKFPLSLVLIGSDKGGTIAAKVRDLKLGERIKLLGFREDAAQLASLFDIACLPSTRREGVPRSIVEAMSHGKPCVVTDVGGLPDLVEHNQNGFIVPPLNSESLRDSLEKLIESKELRDQFGSASRQRFDFLFSLERYHEEMRDFFERIPLI